MIRSCCRADRGVELEELRLRLRKTVRRPGITAIVACGAVREEDADSESSVNSLSKTREESAIMNRRAH